MLEFFGVADLSILPHLLIYSIIYVWTYDIYFILWVLIQYYFISIIAQIVTTMANGAFSIGSCVSLTHPHNCV